MHQLFSLVVIQFIPLMKLLILLISVTTITSKLSSASINGESQILKLLPLQKLLLLLRVYFTPQETETKISTAICTLLPVQTINVMNKQRLLVLKFTLVKKLFIPLIVHYQVLLNKTTNSVETPKSNPSNPSSLQLLKIFKFRSHFSNTTKYHYFIPPVTINVISKYRY